MTKGMLTITLHEAVLTRNTELWGKMDPFAVWKHNGNKQKSQIIDNAGFTPKWENAHFDFTINQANDQI